MRLKIVIAPDSFKGNLNARQVARALERGARRVFPDADYVLIPMADGGEGTVDVLATATQGRIVRKRVHDPLGRKIGARYALLETGNSAIIEVAEAIGLPLLDPAERNPMQASTQGVGELIADALARGVRQIIIGIGGSATNDGGAGMAQALGACFLDSRGKPIRQTLNGRLLGKVQRIDVSGLNQRLGGTRFTVACDVNNPLCGRKGASHVFGPQKGASPAMLKTLDANLRHWGKLIRRDLGQDVMQIPGSGAAGGLGAGLLAFCRAKIRPGVDVVLDMVDLKRQLKDADLVITGEGSVDAQTAFGKAPAGVAALARRCNVPTIVIGGRLDDSAHRLFQHGIAGLESACARDITLEEALSQARTNLANAAERTLRLVRIGGRIQTRRGRRPL